jgi:hypothetical protein
MPPIEEYEPIRQRLLNHFFQPSPFIDPPQEPFAASGVNAIGVGMVDPADDAPRFLIFVDPAADCEISRIDQEVRALVGIFPYRLLFSPKLVGLQAVPPPPVQRGFSIAAYDPYRYNIPPVSAGTLGAKVIAAGTTYILSCNHVLSCDGRVPEGAPIFCPGPKGDRQADPWYNVAPGQAIASRSAFVPLHSPGWPCNPLANINTVDCALAAVARGAVLQLNTPCPVLSALSAVTDVQKTGRATGLTQGSVRIWNLAGWVDFSFGTFFFDRLVATFEPIAPYPQTGTRPMFAAPGDSGSIVLDGNSRGVGLAMARGYCFSPPGPTLASGALTGVLIAICSLDLIAEGLASEMGLNKTDFKFFT